MSRQARLDACWPELPHASELPVTLSCKRPCNHSIAPPPYSHILQTPCRKSPRASLSARSATRTRRKDRPLSALRDRSAPLCPQELAFPLLAYRPRDGHPPNRAAQDRTEEMCRENGRSGRTRRRTWSRGGTRRRSRPCPATLEMGPCRTCRLFPASIATKMLVETEAHQPAARGAG